MLKIDELHLVLPAGFEQRAEGIARLIAGELARLTPAISGRFERLAAPPIEVSPDSSDADIATRVALAIHERLATRAVANRGGQP
jgi:hypothetical protein